MCLNTITPDFKFFVMLCFPCILITSLFLLFIRVLLSRFLTFSVTDHYSLLIYVLSHTLVFVYFSRPPLIHVLVSLCSHLSRSCSSHSHVSSHQLFSLSHPITPHAWYFPHLHPFSNYFSSLLCSVAHN